MPTDQKYAASMIESTALDDPQHMAFVLDEVTREAARQGLRISSEMQVTPPRPYVDLFRGEIEVVTVSWFLEPIT